jgi:DNA-binding FadR family transcriptional regulator
MVAAIIRPTTVLLPDADAAARYACTMLQYRGTTLTDLHEARTHLEAAAVETLAGRRSAADLRRLDVHSITEYMISDPSETVLDVTS